MGTGHIVGHFLLFLCIYLLHPQFDLTNLILLPPHSMGLNPHEERQRRVSKQSRWRTCIYMPFVSSSRPLSAKFGTTARQMLANGHPPAKLWKESPADMTAQLLTYDHNPAYMSRMCFMGTRKKARFVCYQFLSRHFLAMIVSASFYKLYRRAPRRLSYVHLELTGFETRLLDRSWNWLAARWTSPKVICI